METLIGFPASIALILAVSLMTVRINPENTTARSISYLAAVMLIVSVGFTINVFLQGNMVTLGLIATFTAAGIMFLKAIDVIKWKLSFILYGAEAIIVAIAALILK